MKEKLQVESCKLQVQNRQADGLSAFHLPPSTFNRRRGFSLIEIMVVVGLLSLIVLALMAVFSSTQSAFRASITQTDVLEGGRNAMDLIASDLKEMTASGGVSNVFIGPVNFCATNVNYNPLIQSLPATSGSPPPLRTNVLENVFWLTRENQTWTGIGYKVDYTNSSPINALYRFSWTTNINANPWAIYTNFIYTPAVQMSHLIDGVVDLRVRVYDPNGIWMTNGYQTAPKVRNVTFYPAYGEVGCIMYSNTLPAAVEVQLGVLEDRTLQRAESIGNSLQQSNYLSSHAGQVHIFRQRVSIPNADPSVYQ